MTVRIAIVGDKGVGKSALVHLCVKNLFQPIAPSGKDVAHRLLTAKNAVVDLIDFNGKNDALISCADGFIICYSITDRKSFENIESILIKIVDLNIKRPKIAIIGNKNDLDDQRQVSVSDGLNFAKELKVLFYETSALVPSIDFRQVLNELRKSILSSRKSEKKVKHTNFLSSENLLNEVLDKSIINTKKFNGCSRNKQERVFGTIKKKLLKNNHRLVK
nr:ras-related and estrogen-regulated growth inhibitor [Hydra vulgaris]